MRKLLPAHAIRQSLVLATVLILSSAVAFASNGIFTTNAQLGVNINHYANRLHVYLNGGPSKCDQNGLDDGDYYFEVRKDGDNTDPLLLLSTDKAVQRKVTISNGRIVDASDHSLLSGYCGGSVVQLMPFALRIDGGKAYRVVLIKASTLEALGNLPGPNDTALKLTNGPDTKSDQFEIDEDPEATADWPLQGRKFYDTNANGVKDDNENWIRDWQVRGIGDSPMNPFNVTSFGPTQLTPNYPDNSGDYFSAVVTTNIDGIYSFDKLTVGGIYGVAEILPAAPTGAVWVATKDRDLGPGATFDPEPNVDGNYSFDGGAGGKTWESNIFCPRHVVTTTTPSNADLNANSCVDQLSPSLATVTVELDLVFAAATPLRANIEPGRGPVDFGNVCKLVGGKTLGFWSNKNGSDQIGGNANLVALLSGLNLKGAKGIPFVPTTYALFRDWILKATAKDMRYMLSAQLAATTLAVNTGLIDGTLTILFDGDSITIDELITRANDELASPGGADQELLKNALDDINNNRITLTSDGCSADFDGRDISSTDGPSITSSIEALTLALGGRL